MGMLKSALRVMVESLIGDQVLLEHLADFLLTHLLSDQMGAERHLNLPLIIIVFWLLDGVHVVVVLGLGKGSLSLGIVALAASGVVQNKVFILLILEGVFPEELVPGRGFADIRQLEAAILVALLHQEIGDALVRKLHLEGAFLAVHVNVNHFVARVEDLELAHPEMEVVGLELS